MNLRVLIWGMYDCHMFHGIKANSVEGIIEKWLEHNSKPTACFFEGSDRPHNLGPSALCPAIVLNGDKELRRVGNMIHDKDQDLEPYRKALLADPDISRLLKEGAQ